MDWEFGERLLTLSAAFAPAILIALILFALGQRTLPAGVRNLALIAGPFAALTALAGGGVMYAIALADPALAKHAAVRAFVGAAIPEEIGKLVLLVTVVLRNFEADARRDAILCGAWLGLGFGAIENFLYVTDSEQWAYVSLSRAVTAVPSHVAIGALMGWPLQRLGVRRGWWLALLLPLILHGLYDWPLMAIDVDEVTLKTAAFFAVFVVTLVVEGVLVALPVAMTLRETSRSRALPMSGVTTPGLAMGVTTVAELLRIGGMIAVGVGVVAALTIDARYAALVAMAVLPLTFAELWRHARA